MSSDPLRPGRVAFVTQSAALGAAVLDWAEQRQIGFSAFQSLEGSKEASFGECLDRLAEDPNTQSILLYIESIGDAGRFLSAARECALRKPIIVLKAGRRDRHADAVFDAAFRRCGVLRVNRIADLFYLADVLARQPRPNGPRLAIISNAQGPGLLAADALSVAGGELCELVDLGGAAGAKDYEAALDRLAADSDCHGILSILTPQPETDIEGTATLLAARAAATRKTMLASFMGGEKMRTALGILRAGKLPAFPYADTGARAFQELWQYSSSLNGLYETPVFKVQMSDSSAIGEELETLRNRGEITLAEETLRRLFAAYGLQWGKIAGFEFTMNSEIDASFGPVLYAGAAGLGDVVYEDQAAGLPPLTSTLARRMMEMLRLHRVCSRETRDAVEQALVRFSHLVSDLPILRKVRIDLMHANGSDVKISVAQGSLQPLSLARELWPRCVIRPYPHQYVHAIELRDGAAAVIRPIRPEDEELIADFHRDLSERTVYLRYLQFLKFEQRISHERLARVCFNDYARELALVLEKDGRILGVGRMQRNPLRMEEAEVAFLVRDTAQGAGIGGALVRSLTGAARQEGLRKLTAELLADNGPMRHLLEKAGFRMRLAMDGQTLLGSLVLVPEVPEAG